MEKRKVLFLRSISSSKSANTWSRFGQTLVASLQRGLCFVYPAGYWIHLCHLLIYPRLPPCLLLFQRFCRQPRDTVFSCLEGLRPEMFWMSDCWNFYCCSHRVSASSEHELFCLLKKKNKKKNIQNIFWCLQIILHDDCLCLGFFWNSVNAKLYQ